MSEQKLAAEVRTEFGKGFARRARMANLIPAVIYGHGAEPIHITLPAKATTLAVRTANALLTAIEVSIEGRSAGEHIHASDLVLPKGSTLLADPEALVVNISEATENVEEGEEGEA